MLWIVNLAIVFILNEIILSCIIIYNNFYSFNIVYEFLNSIPSF